MESVRNDFSGFGHCCCQRWISTERNIWKDESGDIQGTETVNVTLCGCLPGQNYGHIVAEAAAAQRPHCRSMGTPYQRATTARLVEHVRHA